MKSSEAGKRMKRKKEMDKSFDEEWEYIHSTQEWGMYPTEHVIRFVARNFYKLERKNVKILDFGCGVGAHAWYMAREGFDVYAFDGSASAVDKARRRLEGEHLPVHLKVADALDISYPENFFDAVVDNVCIYGNLLKNIHSMYQNVHSILKPEGKLLTTCFGKRTEGYGTGEALERDTYIHIKSGVLVGRGITHFYSKEELEEVLLLAGFKNPSIDVVLYTDNQVLVEQFIAIAEK